ncbi:hypothetical protein Lupro_03025 [Lutibacter profundi]|uniref:Uncharacterized protein n=1 Tax=Lutibacter profundi TaxID=1622118 RepID=A0A0X8G577_9FLAO|nr:hypothetical protein [Lutibacter profundi]AMC10288.1 hypothetical protein Lupro_03025 [Lutibacter profundi]
MKKLLLIFTAIGIISCKEKNVVGVWMSYNDRVIDYNKSFVGGQSGYVIDFDNNNWSHMLSDSVKRVNFDFKRKFFQIFPDTTSYDFKIYKKDSIEIELFENTMSVFRPLNLNYKINRTKKQIFDFLTQNKFENIRDSTSIEFSESFHRFDKNKELRLLKGNSFNSPIIGYWYLGEIHQNYFLFFTIDDCLEHNIYQIKSLENDRLLLKKIQENDLIFGLNELKTSL